VLPALMRCYDVKQINSNSLPHPPMRGRTGGESILAWPLWSQWSPLGDKEGPKRHGVTLLPTIPVKKD